MALFSKLFDRSHNPYTIPGARWYKTSVRFDGDNGLSIINSDAEIIDLNEGFTDFKPGHVYVSPGSYELTFLNMSYIDSAFIMSMKGAEVPAYFMLKPNTPYVQPYQISENDAVLTVFCDLGGTDASGPIFFDVYMFGTPLKPVNIQQGE